MGAVTPVCLWTGVACLQAGGTDSYSITLAGLRLQGALELEAGWHALRIAAKYS